MTKKLSKEEEDKFTQELYKAIKDANKSTKTLLFLIKVFSTTIGVLFVVAVILVLMAIIKLSVEVLL